MEQQQPQEPLTRKCFVCNTIFNVDTTKSVSRDVEIASWRIFCKYVSVPEEEVDHLVEYNNYYARYLTFCPEKCHKTLERIISLHNELEKLSSLFSSTIVHHSLAGQKNNYEEQEKGIKRLKKIIVKKYRPKKVKKPKNTNGDFASDLQYLNSFLNSQPEEGSSDEEEEEEQGIFPISDVKIESEVDGNEGQTYVPNNYNCNYQSYESSCSSSSITPFPLSMSISMGTIPNVDYRNNNNNNNNSGGAGSINNNRSADEAPRRLGKKRTRNPDEWGRNKQKLQRQSGEEYTITRKIVAEDGKTETVEIKRSGRRMGPRCQSKTCLKSKIAKCNEFRESDRQRLFYTLWKTLNWTEKREWVLALVDSKPVKQRRRQTVKPSRTLTYIYHLPYRQFEKKVVCREMFISTLGIKRAQIASWLKARENQKLHEVHDEEEEGGEEEDNSNNGNDQ